LDKEEDPQMFSLERDANFEGLQMPAEDPKTCPNPLPRGRVIEVNAVLDDLVDENDILFDRDLGESSKDKD